MLEIEPNKYQLLFCLGLIDLSAKGDKSRALQEFVKFLELAEPDCYPDQIGLAETHVAEIQEEMKKCGI